MKVHIDLTRNDITPPFYRPLYLQNLKLSCLPWGKASFLLFSCSANDCLAYIGPVGNGITPLAMNPDRSVWCCYLHIDSDACRKLNWIHITGLLCESRMLVTLRDSHRYYIIVSMFYEHTKLYDISVLHSNTLYDCIMWTHPLMDSKQWCIYIVSSSIDGVLTQQLTPWTLCQASIMYKCIKTL